MNDHTGIFRFAGVAFTGMALACSAARADEAADLAKQISNPVANLISVPIQYNWDTGLGSTDADRSTLYLQPVLPFSISDEWNLISRTIIPLVDAEPTSVGAQDHSGLGDTVQSIFFSPKAPTADGWIWGAGPILLLPTASDDALGTEKWGAGPTAVALKQENGWTYGALGYQLWSVAGDAQRADVNLAFVQPFLVYTTKTYTTFVVNTESTYDWDAQEWTVPVNLMVSQLLKFGKQPLSLQLGYRHYLDAPSGGPEWGVRFSVTLLFPK